MAKSSSEWLNKLYYGDNLDVLRECVADESADLIYLDPPFNSNRSYNVLFKDKSGEDSPAQIEAFDDTWTWSHEAEVLYAEMTASSAPNKIKDALEAMRKLLGDNDVFAYLVMMTARLIELRRVLKMTGSLYLHCDPTASHYLKVIIDSLFGAANFRGEVIWKRTGAHGAAKRYAPVHDVILYYSASSDVTWNRIFHGYREEYLKTKYGRWDQRGRYQTVTLMPSGIRKGATGGMWRGINPTEKGLHWRYPPSKLDELDAEGMLDWGKSGDCIPRLKRYLNEGEGVPLQDVWTDIAPINSQARERLGYPTQKPLALLERILEASSNPGDLILDPFCGCGTAVDAAQKLGRKWIGVDITTLAIDLIDARLRHAYGEWITTSYEILGIPRDIAGARALLSRSPFEFKRWCVRMVEGRPNDRNVGEGEVDGVIRVPIDVGDSSDRILVSAKGEMAAPWQVRDLVKAVISQKAAMGVFITLRKPTKTMIETAQRAGIYTWPLGGKKYPKVQIITVEELLKDKRPMMPPTLLPYFQTPRRNDDDSG
ncbi:DNA methyltransferase [Nonomuraea sp. NPDC049750]|uniref:site-specific DNA-methyltransferase n=1 Tax=Nonomuraea sp. NPDC049750 TaxID=3154738 RepID=UPI0033F3F361